MSFAERFEDLEIWQAAQELAVLVYQDFVPKSAAARDFGFINPVRDAVVSISNSVAEGFECAACCTCPFDLPTSTPRSHERGFHKL